MNGSLTHLRLLGSLALAATLGACGTERDGAANDAAVDTMMSQESEPQSTTLLDPNAATREELLKVPGIDTTAADALIDARPYEDMRGVDRALAAHLSAQEREAAYDRLWRPLDLNSATAEEILLIPGVGERMQHEFEEYRPYRAMEQFRREIGKYVDEAEVARLERYVVIR